MKLGIATNGGVAPMQNQNNEKEYDDFEKGILGSQFNKFKC